MPRDAASTRPEDRTLRITLDLQTLQDLEALSRQSGQSREQLAADAIRERVARQIDPSLGTDRAVPPPKGG